MRVFGLFLFVCLCFTFVLENLCFCFDSIVVEYVVFAFVFEDLNFDSVDRILFMLFAFCFRIRFLVFVLREGVLG